MLTDPTRYGDESEFNRILPEVRLLRTGLTVVTPAEEELLTVAEVRRWLRGVTPDDEDPDIEDLIDEAVEEAERRTGKALISRVLDYTFDGPLPGVIELPVLPASAVTSIKVYDIDNGETTVDAEEYSFDAATGRIYLNNGGVWPTGLRAVASCVVRYTAGDGTATDVPVAIKQWCKRFVAHQYEHRGDDPRAFPDGTLAGRRTYRL